LILIFAASRLFKLVEQRRIGCGRGESYLAVGEITTYVKTKILWHVNTVYMRNY